MKDFFETSSTPIKQFFARNNYLYLLWLQCFLLLLLIASMQFQDHFRRPHASNEIVDKAWEIAQTSKSEESFKANLKREFESNTLIPESPTNFDSRIVVILSFITFFAVMTSLLVIFGSRRLHDEPSFLDKDGKVINHQSKLGLLREYIAN